MCTLRPWEPRVRAMVQCQGCSPPLGSSQSIGAGPWAAETGRAFSTEREALVNIQKV